MTDRVNGLVVVLDHDMRSDDVQVLVEAIKCLRFVTAVSTNVIDFNDYMNRERIRAEFSEKLWEVLHPKK